ncbi:neural proliferation differentiation and control protein 1 isoform X1 [Protopterus annectens]|uniref:neural proliferation differentiation and control protein 1 isoform X1 n=1 Tax=Protopterus annectens TaxID=7888 RepID=UPI001CFC27F4|nr:neural proliferation differentiation and control protein 1 isoform X1 [Protopterus annectens]
MAAALSRRCCLQALLLLGGVALLGIGLGVVDAADVQPSGNSCPGKLNCALLQKRTPCSSGSSRCGACIDPLVEDKNQVCVKRKKRQSGKAPEAADLEKEIDDLASILDKQKSDQQLAQNAAVPSSNNTGNKGAGAQPAVRNAAATTTNPANTASLMAVKGAPMASPRFPDDAVLLGLVILCSVTGVCALIIAGVCWAKLHKDTKLAKKTDYPAFKGSAPPPYERAVPGDAKLAQSAQMYHYQHQKQQMISMEKNKEDLKVSDSASASDEENEDGDYTVYECPGLAPTGEMEVKNPLFDDSSLHHAVPRPHQ